MCCSTSAFTQIKYDVVNAYAVLHYCVGHHRHTVKKIFELQRSLIYDATNIPALLEKHDSVYVLYTENGEVYQEEYYSKEYCYTFFDGELYEMESDMASLITNHSYHYCYDNTYTQGILLTPDGMVDVGVSLQNPQKRPFFRKTVE